MQALMCFSDIWVIARFIFRVLGHHGPTNLIQLCLELVRISLHEVNERNVVQIH
ncbi:hypothetical protein Sjap_015676 [Stephania japonica]|uniref:Uncharacterized protein n=1 Tax=Stephania japonica TaxID=461633 RepID=A0AAP0IJK6_9MAGN